MDVGARLLDLVGASVPAVLGSWPARVKRWFTGDSSKSPQGSADGSPAPAASGSRFYHESASGRHLIVFVHGVFGSFATTWGQADLYWPRLLAGDARFNGHDVYLIDYPSHYISTSANIHEVAVNELRRLRDRKVFEKYEQIHFIAHSMGGLVAKIMITHLARQIDDDHLRRVRSVVFLATPAQGAAVAELGAWLSLNPQLVDMTRAHANTFLQALEDEWVLLLINRDRARARFPRAYCAYERMPLLGTLVVPRELAYTRSDSDPYPMPFDHHGMSTPTSRDKDPYEWTMARVQEAEDFDRSLERIGRLLASVETLAVSGRADDARRACEEAIALSRQLGDSVVYARALGELAAFELAAGRNDESRARFAEALVLCRTDPERRGEARILSGLADLERLMGHLPEARQRYFEALAAFRAAADRPGGAAADRAGEAAVLRGLGELERQGDNYDQATRFFEEALALYGNDKQSRGRALVLAGMATIERYQGHFPAARALFMQANAVFEHVNDQRGLGYGLFGLANVDIRRGDQQAGLDNLRRARQAFERSGIGRRGQAHVLVLLGEQEFKLGRPDQARAAWEEAKGLYRAIGDRLGEANVLRWLGELERHLGSVDDAMTNYVEARSLYRNEGSRLGPANAVLGLADISRGRGRYDLARARYTEAGIVYDAVGDPSGQARVLTGIGSIACALRGLETAETAFNKALALVSEHKYPGEAAAVLCGIGALEHARGRIEHAGNAYTRAKAIYVAEGDRRGEPDALCGLGDHGPHEGPARRRPGDLRAGAQVRTRDAVSARRGHRAARNRPG